ncbi:MAG: response regulator [Planctomycetaceae bacterium]|nr:response regulator [Planctomycetaceae bacterium]
MAETDWKVLIAEDNSVFANVMRLTLAKVGLQVTVAGDGAQALSALANDHFDLLITDEQMPHLSGHELCARIRADQRLCDLPIFFCTAKGWEMNVAELKREFGVQEVFIKPFSPRRLASAITSFLEQHQAALPV